MPKINEKSSILTQGSSYSASTKGVTIAGETKTYATIADRDADARPGTFAFVRDAKADSTVKRGFAIYYRRDGAWKKVFEEEAMDKDISDLVTYNWNALIDGPASEPTAIDAAVEKAHEHANKSTLDKIDEASNYLTYNGQPLKATPFKYTKYLQLIRPVSPSDALDCTVEIYSIGEEGELILKQQYVSTTSRDRFKYFNVDANEFTKVGDAGFPAKAAGTFVIVDIADSLTDKDVYIKWEWSKHNSLASVSRGMCVYPSVTPTNTESVGLIWNEVE